MMKKRLAITGAIMLFIALFGLVFYYRVLPKWIASTIIDEASPALPKRILTIVEPFKGKINEGTEDVIKTMHREGIAMEEVLTVIDETEEQNLYAFADSVSQLKQARPEDVFEIAKHFFPTDFDPEVFREDFRKNVNERMIRRALHYIRMNERAQEVDFETIKAIAKSVLIEKEKRMLSRSETSSFLSK